MIEALKSAGITNSDASPRVANTAGEGGPSRLSYVDGYVTVSAAAAAGSTYCLVRLPSFAKVKRVLFESEAQGAGKFHLGAYYASAGPDQPHNAANAGAVIDADFFASLIDCASAVAVTDVTNESGTNTLALRVKPLWEALGLSADPGGKIDIVATVNTTDVTTGTGKLGVAVEYVE